MVIYRLKVSERVITLLSIDNISVGGNKGDKAIFDLDDEWSSGALYGDLMALFVWNGKYYPSEIKSNASGEYECEVPPMYNTSNFRIGIYIGEDANSEPYLSTTEIEIPCRLSIRDFAVSAHNEVGKNYTYEALGYATEAKNAAQSAKESALQAEERINASTRIVQAAGNDSTVVMSQKATTDLFNSRLIKLNIAVGNDFISIDTINGIVTIPEGTHFFSENEYFELSEDVVLNLYEMTNSSINVVVCSKANKTFSIIPLNAVPTTDFENYYYAFTVRRAASYSSNKVSVDVDLPYYVDGVLYGGDTLPRLNITAGEDFISVDTTARTVTIPKGTELFTKGFLKNISEDIILNLIAPSSSSSSAVFYNKINDTFGVAHNTNLVNWSQGSKFYLFTVRIGTSGLKPSINIDLPYYFDGILYGGGVDTNAISESIQNLVTSLGNVEETLESVEESLENTEGSLESIQESSQNFENAFDVKYSSNVLDLRKASYGKELSTTTGLPISSTNPNKYVSDYIPCNAGDVLRHQFTYTDGIRRDNEAIPTWTSFDVASYDANKSYVSNSMADDVGVYIVPDDASYIRISYIANATGSDHMFFFSNSAEIIPYSEYGEILSVNFKTDVPSYWREHLAEKIGMINERSETVALNGDSFVFITDYHIERNAGNSHILIDEIVKNTSVKNVIFGGDIFNGDTTHEGALDKLRTWYKRFSPLQPYCLRGNHEYNLNDGGSEAVKLSESEIYNYLNKDKEYCIDGGSDLYYFKDNDRQKIRYIFLDTKNEVNPTVIDDAQIAWMKERITELSSGWTVVVLSHIGIDKLSDGSVAFPSYYTSSLKIKAALDEIKTSIQATIACWICGHTHNDLSLDCDGYIVISTTCDTMYGSSMIKFTDTEQAFDIYSIDTLNRKIYITRVGAGNNREFYY